MFFAYDVLKRDRVEDRAYGDCKRDMTEAGLQEKRTTQQTGQHGIGGISSPDDRTSEG